MRLSAVAPIVPALTAAAASATGSLAFVVGTDGLDGLCKTQSDYEADYDAISTHMPVKILRVYAASTCDCVQNILPAAKSKGFQVILGIWCAPIGLRW
jgi:glucan 1,3-beta-glucosidase